MKRKSLSIRQDVWNKVEKFVEKYGDSMKVKTPTRIIEIAVLSWINDVEDKYEETGSLPEVVAKNVVEIRDKKTGRLIAKIPY